MHLYYQASEVFFVEHATAHKKLTHILIWGHWLISIDGAAAVHSSIGCCCCYHGDAAAIVASVAAAAAIDGAAANWWCDGAAAVMVQPSTPFHKCILNVGPQMHFKCGHCCCCSSNWWCCCYSMVRWCCYCCYRHDADGAAVMVVLLLLSAQCWWHCMTLLARRWWQHDPDGNTTLVLFLSVPRRRDRWCLWWHFGAAAIVPLQMAHWCCCYRCRCIGVMARVPLLSVQWPRLKL